ncbi:MAG TPA: bifunctional sugar-1-phosphate nucleotidylyltransferase/acetyltransferase [Candidatus Bathyarchaeia archaeon]|nr:bifunctional sugar-1-phosphate nucleotidylyltransferase/acetyltransferase [Candidatus Bathyarchaeia archaeon]
MRALVLAAGKGERLWPLTETIPKPLLPICGKSLLERILNSLVQSGIRDITLLVKFQAWKIRKGIGNGSQYGCRVSYVEQKTLGGTADAVRACRQRLMGESRFLVIYADNYYQDDALRAFVTRSSRTAGMALATGQAEDTSPFGRVTVKQGRVVRIMEKTRDHRPGLVNAGLYMLDNSIFDAIDRTRRSKRGELELTDSLKLMIQRRNAVSAIPFRRGKWFGISYPWDLLDANEQAIKVERTVRKGHVEKNVHIKDNLSLGSGTIVKSGTYIEGPVYVGENSVIGPNAYLRAYTSIGDDVRVGAGCEVKNSILMDAAKIPHLSYVGDSIIGPRSTLGARTITANLRFDGKPVKSKVKNQIVTKNRRKLGAIIGENVKTGINVSILPGVKIGAGAWIGPGVVLEHDVPSGSRVRRS